MTQSPRKTPTSIAGEFAGDVAKDVAKTTGTLLGMALFQALAILGLILVGAVACGAGLYFQIWVVAIIGGVLIGAGVLWAAVLAFLFFAPHW